MSRALDNLAHRHRTKLVFSRPGGSSDNSFSEAFTGRFHVECLDQHWFARVEEARQIIGAWRIDENEVRPHTALDNQTPAAYKAAYPMYQAREEAGQRYGWTRNMGHISTTQPSDLTGAELGMHTTRYLLPLPRRIGQHVNSFRQSSLRYSGLRKVPRLSAGGNANILACHLSGSTLGQRRVQDRPETASR